MFSITWIISYNLDEKKKTKKIVKWKRRLRYLAPLSQFAASLIKNQFAQMAWEEDVSLSPLSVIRFNLFYFLWLASDVELFLFVYLQLVCEYLSGPNFMFWLWLLVWIVIVIEFLFLISQSILLVGYSYKPSLKIGWSGWC